MTYKDLKAHCDQQDRCADCEYDGCKACDECAPYMLVDDDPRLSEVIPAANLLKQKQKTPLLFKSSASYIILICVLILALVALSFFFEVIAPADITRHEQPPTSMFVEVESTNKWYVVYHRETLVMYAVSRGQYEFTPLLNADGTPMLYNE